jgi:prepilin-type processing-associated H-X9-DG protein
MSILFTCPHCGTKSQVGDQYAGQTGPCAACGKTVTVPYPGSASSGGGGGVMAAVLVVLGIVGVLLVLCIGFGAFGLFFVGRSAQVASKRMQSSNNLRQIGLALHNYHDQWNCFPPPYVTDKNGNKLYSWRVLILPYIEESPLYDQFNKNEPWDSPNNRPLAMRMPFVFRSPSHVGDPTMTDYAGFVGKETFFDPQAKVSFGQVIDGTSNTLAVVEVKNSSINWAEPRDIDFDKSTFTINAAADDIGGSNPGGCNVLFADGSVQFLKSAIPAVLLRAMVTKGGGEVVDRSQF